MMKVLLMATLAALFFPEVHDWKTPPAGASSRLSIETARHLIGFELAYSVASVSVEM